MMTEKRPLHHNNDGYDDDVLNERKEIMARHARNGNHSHTHRSLLRVTETFFFLYFCCTCKCRVYHHPLEYDLQRKQNKP